MKNNNQWIDSRSPEAVTYAANVWKIGKPETWGRLDRAIEVDDLSPNLPFSEFKEYVESLITCPVCRVTTPIDATNCPSCKVDLQIARGQINVGPKPKLPSPNIPNEERVLGEGSGVGQKKKPSIIYYLGWGFIFFCLFLVAWGMFVTPIINAASITNQQPQPTSVNQVSQNANATLAARATPTPDCLLWSTITPSMAGQTVCVYGTVSDIRESPSLNASYIYFGTRDEFFFVIPATVFEDLEINHCVYSEGQIEINTYKTPYIRIQELGSCNN